MNYTTESLLAGTHGNALKGVILSTLNWTLASQLANHKSLKMPTEKLDTPDALRDLMAFPEHNGRKTPATADQLTTGVLATCAMLRDLGQAVDYSATGTLIYPFAWLADRASTPASAINSHYEWRNDMAARVAGEQAQLLNLSVKEREQIEVQARYRTTAQNQELKAYAIAEANSLTDLKVLELDNPDLIEVLVDLDGIAFDGLRLAHASACNTVNRAKQRLMSGLFTTVDEEVVLFANSKLPDNNRED